MATSDMSTMIFALANGSPDTMHIAAGIPSPGIVTEPHLKRHANSQHRASGKLSHGLTGKGGRRNAIGKPHVYIKQITEYKAYKQLKQLHRLKATPKYQNLKPHKDKIHYISILTDRKRRHISVGAGQSHNKGDS